MPGPHDATELDLHVPLRRCLHAHQPQYPCIAAARPAGVAALPPPLAMRKKVKDISFELRRCRSGSPMRFRLTCRVLVPPHSCCPDDEAGWRLVELLPAISLILRAWSHVGKQTCGGWQAIRCFQVDGLWLSSSERWRSNRGRELSFSCVSWVRFVSQ